MPRANTLFIGRLPPGPAWRAKRRRKRRRQSWRRTRRADVGGCRAADHRLGSGASAAWRASSWGTWRSPTASLVPPPAGGTVLIDSTAGPIAAIAPRDGYQDAVLGFEIVGQDTDGTRTANTNWPSAAELSDFLAERARIFGARGEEQESAPVRPGRPVELTAPAGTSPELTVVDPAASETTVAALGSRTCFSFTTPTSRAFTTSAQGDPVIERFAVNLFDRAESDVRVRPTPGSGESDRAAGRYSDRPRRRCGHGRPRPGPAGDLEAATGVCPVRAGVGMVYLQSSGVSLIAPVWWHGSCSIEDVGRELR